jgi:SAM-dependent methyltransferase
MLADVASSVVNVDVSEEVVQAMKQIYVNSSNSEFYTLDVFNLPDSWAPFDTIVDKAAIWDLRRNSAGELRQLLCLVKRLLRPKGFFAVITSGTMQGMESTLQLAGKYDAPSMVAYFPLASTVDGSAPLPFYTDPDVPLGMYLFQFSTDTQSPGQCPVPENKEEKL